MSKPNSTALENVALLRTLDRAMGREMPLIFLAGASTQEGIVHPEGRWRYQFGDIINGAPRLYEWSVYQSGRVEYVGERPYIPIQPRLDFTEVGSLIAIDSPEAARLARAHGGQAYIDRFPEAYPGMVYRFIGREPVCEIRFYASGAPCTHGPFYIHATTGALMARQLACLDQLSSP